MTAATHEPAAIAARPDDELIQAVLKGDRRWYQELFRRHATPVFRYAMSLTRNATEAEDLFQEAFSKAFAKLHQYHGPNIFKRWLFRICRNLAINRMHKRKVDETPIEKQPEGNLGAREPQKEWLEAMSVSENTRRLLASLTPELQEIMLLRLVEDLSYREIADLTGHTEVNLRQMISRGLTRLRKEWSPHAVQQL